MKCPHCLVSFHPPAKKINDLGNDKNFIWLSYSLLCPGCKTNIIYIIKRDLKYSQVEVRLASSAWDDQEIMVWPKGISRSPLPPEVPEKYAEDYKEACLVVSDSPKASAALSRRCLQNLLREEFKVKPGDLYDEIQEVINHGTLPTHLSDAIDAVRIIGNFAAHPMKSKSTGEILHVEPGEAEWNLDVLEGIFDFCFVQPEVLKKKKEALNKKLVDAGKQPMK